MKRSPCIKLIYRLKQFDEQVNKNNQIYEDTPYDRYLDPKNFLKSTK